MSNDKTPSVSDAIKTQLQQAIAPLNPRTMLAGSLIEAYDPKVSIAERADHAGSRMAEKLEHANSDIITRHAVTDALLQPEIAQRLSTPSREAIIDSVSSIDTATLAGNQLKTALVQAKVTDLNGAIAFGRASYDVGEQLANAVANSVNNLDLPELPKLGSSNPLDEVASGLNPQGTSLASGLSSGDGLPSTYQVSIGAS